MTEIENTAAWTLVVPRRQKGGKRLAKSNVGEKLGVCDFGCRSMSPEECVSVVTEKKRLTATERSDINEVIDSVLMHLKRTIYRKGEIVCLGLGSPTRSLNSLKQLIVLQEIRTATGPVLAGLEVWVSDPVFDDNDLNVFSVLDIKVFPSNETLSEASNLCDKHVRLVPEHVVIDGELVVYFCPHCPQSVNAKLLNEVEDSFAEMNCEVVLVMNDIRNCLDEWVDPKDEMKQLTSSLVSSWISRNAGCVRYESLLMNKENDFLNDMVTIFSSEKAE